MSPLEVRNQIEAITADLISAGICIDQNFPVVLDRGEIQEVNFGKTEDLSITLKNVPYVDAYATLAGNRSYNMKFIDGGIIQVLYGFRNQQIYRHRLAFFPSPNLLEYQNNSEVYEMDELFGDVLERNVVTVPIRFDYDINSAVDYDHPASHLTIGQYKNCRIPVSSAIGPFHFINFVLRSFYNTPFNKFCSHIKEHEHSFDETITGRESSHMHVRVAAAA